MKNFLAVAIEMAIEAGKAINEIYQTDFDVKIKEDHSPVTKADLVASSILKKGVEIFGFPFLSEEDNSFTYEERSMFKRYWLVDPLDGTKEFVKRNGEFTVNIALVEDNKPILGVVYAPIFDLLYFGFDQGSFKLENAIQNTENQTIDAIVRQSEKLPILQKRENFIVLTSRSHKTAEVDEFIEKLKLSHQNCEILAVGSSLKNCMLAEGSADIYPCYSYTSEWDTAASQIVLEKSGGKITLTDNASESLKYNKASLKNPFFIALKN